MTTAIDPKKDVSSVVSHIDLIIEIINKYQTNRHGSIAITRLEEAVMWINAMVHSYPGKDTDKKNDDKINENFISD